MKVHSLILGNAFQSNCYVLENDNKEAIAFDIGGDSSEFIKFINNNGLKLQKILLTHGHYDHFAGVAASAAAFSVEVYIHSEDAQMLTDARKSLACYVGEGSFNSINSYIKINDGDIIDFSGIPVKVLHTPGHTKGGVCYICEDMIFSGDTLFRLSIGRTDFPGGSMMELTRSLDKLAELCSGKDYIVYPGHNNSTTLSFEIENNPYIQ